MYVHLPIRLFTLLVEKTPVQREISIDAFFNFEAEFEGLEISPLIGDIVPSGDPASTMIKLPELPRQQQLDPDLVEVHLLPSSPPPSLSHPF